MGSLRMFWFTMHTELVHGYFSFAMAVRTESVIVIYRIPGLIVAKSSLFVLLSY